jgi:hypothetical protein
MFNRKKCSKAGVYKGLDRGIHGTKVRRKKRNGRQQPQC